MASWYRRHLGLAVSPGGQVATWSWPSSGRHRTGNTLWAALAENDRDWGPANPAAQLNYRVDDLEAVLARLRRRGVTVEDRIDVSAYGRFGWAVDIEGNRFELWEPPGVYRSPERHVRMR